MKLVLSSNFTEKECDIVRNIFKAIFISNNQDINNDLKDKKVFVSNTDRLEKPDFVIKVNDFISKSDNFYKNSLLRNLNKWLFNSNVNASDILSVYESISSETPISLPIKKIDAPAISKDADTIEYPKETGNFNNKKSSFNLSGYFYKG